RLDGGALRSEAFDFLGFGEFVGFPLPGSFTVNADPICFSPCSTRGRVAQVWPFEDTPGLFSAEVLCVPLDAGSAAAWTAVVDVSGGECSERALDRRSAAFL